MHDAAEQLFRPYGPVLGKQINVSVAATNTHVDLTSDADYDPLEAAIAKGLLLELSADDDVGYRWSTAASGEVVAFAATATAGTAAQQCKRLYAGERVVERVPPGTVGLVVIGASATVLRITVCSRRAEDLLALNS